MLNIQLFKNIQLLKFTEDLNSTFVKSTDFTKMKSLKLASFLNSFLIHPKFLEELRTLLKTDLKGKESIFFKILTTQLSNIKNFGSKIYTIDSNEILQGADGHYYSIHLQKSQFNVRLIVYINDENIPYFLCAFNERSGKNRTNYSTYTTVMKERINYFLGDDNYE